MTKKKEIIQLTSQHDNDFNPNAIMKLARLLQSAYGPETGLALLMQYAGQFTDPDIIDDPLNLDVKKDNPNE